MLAFNPFSDTSQNLQFPKKNIRDSNQENLRCCALILNLLSPTWVLPHLCQSTIVGKRVLKIQQWR